MLVQLHLTCFVSLVVVLKILIYPKLLGATVYILLLF